ncbi:siaz-interacting nuclear protein isoform X2 [Pseudorasbora parva]|uniref:siaz-interacting nuclear protein isoform X2 n=1 Tax=Pseudorasbora parva TaxID=51549 RepID=UPI00351F2928
MTVIMAQHNAEQTDVAQSHSDTKTEKRYMSAFKRREPLSFSPKRQYSLAVISPLQTNDSCETVFADGSSSEPSSAPSNYSLETVIEIPRRDTCFQPFSFDERDAARKVERERRLQEMRRMQERLWGSTFKAHPVRRYKPLNQHKDRTRPDHNSLNNV